MNVHLSRADGKRLHLPLEGNPAMTRIIESLAGAGYTGPLTLEIDDLNFNHTLSAEEKVRILAAEKEFIENSLRESR